MFSVAQLTLTLEAVSLVTESTITTIITSSLRCAVSMLRTLVISVLTWVPCNTSTPAYYAQLDTQSCEGFQGSSME